MQSVGEARAVASLGVHHVGVTPSDRGLPGEIDEELAAAICRSIAGVTTSVALSVETDLVAIETMVNKVRPDIVHLCAPSGKVTPNAVDRLRRRIAGTRIMQAIAVTGPEAIEIAKSYAPYIDYLILDSVDPNIAGIGAAGTVHDWTVSRAIVDAVSVPVLLAGGLAPANVAAAIAAVRPWGVDSLTHTNRQLPDGGFRKDLERIEKFVMQARGAASSDG